MAWGFEIYRYKEMILKKGGYKIEKLGKNSTGFLLSPHIFWAINSNKHIDWTTNSINTAAISFDFFLNPLTVADVVPTCTCAYLQTELLDLLPAVRGRKECVAAKRVAVWTFDHSRHSGNYERGVRYLLIYRIFIFFLSASSGPSFRLLCVLRSCFL